MDGWKLLVALLPLLPLALALALDRSSECAEGERRLAETSGDARVATECMVSCTVLTYRRLLESGQRRTVLFRAPAHGDSGRYCWSLQAQCRKGERLRRAFVVLPLRPSGQGAQGTPGLRPTRPLQLRVLRPHDGLAVLSDDCGQRFDVTGPLSALLKTKPSFCVEADPPLGIPGRDLRCPPFLVTTWVPERLSPT